MTKHIIDRRSNPKGKNLSNRQRFIERSKKYIKESLDETINNRSIKDLKSGGRVKVPAKSIKEPQFQYDPKSGEKDYILPGNKEYVPGDKIRKPPQGGQGSGGGSEGSDDAYGEDDFVFSINKDEFLDILFEDLELPDLIEKQKKSIEEFSVERAGYVNEGSPNNLNLEQSMIRSIGRRLALKKPKGRKLRELLEERDKILEFFATLPPGKDHRTKEWPRLQEIEEEIKRIRARYNAISFIDPIDLKFNNFSKVPKPKNAAVMFCILDVSISMQEREKSLAKRFFILLHMFLNMKYDLVDIVFIRHHTVAKECTEEEFFNSKESGGTVASSALELTHEIIKKRYDLEHWNIYISQASDGDNFTTDNDNVHTIMKEKLLPVCQYFTFLCIVPNAGQVHADLRYTAGAGMEKRYYMLSQEYSNIQLGRVYQSKDIYPVFRQFFTPKDKSNE